jgi:hypothetical protein
MVHGKHERGESAGAGAALPAGLEQAQEVLLVVRVGCQRGLVELYSEAGAIGHDDVAVLDRAGAPDDLARPGTWVSSNVSWIKRFGIVASKWALIAVPSGL